MTNNTIALSRELAELCYLALNGGDNQLTGTEHGRAFRELRAALADPVPPAIMCHGCFAEDVPPEHFDEAGKCRGVSADPVAPVDGEPDCEVCHGTGVLPGLTTQATKCSYCDNGWRTIAQAEAELRLADQKEITRLQAENAGMLNECVRRRNSCADLIAERDALQSELTKARECLKDIRQSCELSKLRDAQIDAILSNQSAPADKGQGEPVALHIPDECPHLIVFDDTDREDLMFSGTGAREAALRMWDKISMSWNAHLFVRIKRNSRDDGHPCAKAAQVAVVMPERAGKQQLINNTHYSEGWNDCLDEVARLNPNQK
ncbi:hypothetical protein [Pseudomonas sp. Z1-6]|uniref:hypothetical protein n=1 Tax=Pseudomonas sp. Z1-6 TaxID=2817407 RepID=UPI003DAA18B1